MIPRAARARRCGARRRRQDRPAAGSRRVVVDGGRAGERAGAPRGRRDRRGGRRRGRAPQPPGPSVRETDSGPVGREMTARGHRGRHRGLRGAPPAGRRRRDATPSRSTRPTDTCSASSCRRCSTSGTDAYGGSTARPGAVGRRGGRRRACGCGAGLPGAHQDELRGLRPRRSDRGRDAGERRADRRSRGGRHRVERRHQPLRRPGPHPHPSGIPEDREAYYEDAVPKAQAEGERSGDAGGRHPDLRDRRAAGAAGGYADYIALSRPFICEPDLSPAGSAATGSPSTCLSDNRCFYKGLKREGMYCPHVRRGTWRGRER